MPVKKTRFPTPQVIPTSKLLAVASAFSTMLLLAAPSASAESSVEVDVGFCGSGPCDTHDPDVTCYSGGIWWQTACTSGMEWCDGN